MRMHKRGQVTIFMILGIIIVFAFALLYFLNDYYGWTLAPGEFLEEPVLALQENVRECVDTVVTEDLRLFGLQGGSFVPVHSFAYQGHDVTFLCSALEDGGCMNKMFSLDHATLVLEERVHDRVTDCIDPSFVESKRGYVVTKAPLDVSFDIDPSTIFVLVDYPVAFSKDGVSRSLSTLARSLPIPLGELHKVAYDVVQAHATGQDFYQLPYMLQRYGRVVIGVDTVDSHTVYSLRTDSSDYVFQFAVEDTHA